VAASSSANTIGSVQPLCAPLQFVRNTGSRMTSSSFRSRCPCLWLPILPRVASMLRPRVLLFRLQIWRIHNTPDSSRIFCLFLDVILTILLRSSLHLALWFVQERRLARPPLICSLCQILQLPLSGDISLLLFYRRRIVASVLEPLVPLRRYFDVCVVSAARVTGNPP
jgi:hypothetical protein